MVTALDQEIEVKIDRDHDNSDSDFDSEPMQPEDKLLNNNSMSMDTKGQAWFAVRSLNIQTHYSFCLRSFDYRIQYV